MEFDYGITIEEKGIESFVLRNGRILKRFWGEASYQDATRYAMDLVFQEQRKDKSFGWL